MSEPRLTSAFQISALRRLVEADGGSAAILRKGDATSGNILLVGQIRGRDAALYERFSSLSAEPSWQSVTPSGEPSNADIVGYWRKRADRDPDLWVVELDVASTERLSRLLGTQT